MVPCVPPWLSLFSECYSAKMNEGEVSAEGRRVGLCLDCMYSQRIESARGSVFYRCTLSDSDPAFPKYPRLPVLHCTGHKSSHGEESSSSV